MKFDEYQTLAHTTAVYPEEEAEHYLLTGLAAEVGELLGLFAKAYRGDYPEPHPEAIIKELGDVLWFVSELANLHGYPLRVAAYRNLEKLASRAQRGVLKGNGDDR